MSDIDNLPAPQQQGGGGGSITCGGESTSELSPAEHERPRAESFLSALGGSGSLFGDMSSRCRADSLLGLGSILDDGGGGMDSDLLVLERPRGDSFLSLGEGSLTSLLGGGGASIGGASTSTAAAAFAAVSALHDTGLLEDVTAAAAAIDLPPSPEFIPSSCEVVTATTDFLPMEELVLEPSATAPVVASSSSLSSTNNNNNSSTHPSLSSSSTKVLSDSTPAISNKSRKRLLSDCISSFKAEASTLEVSTVGSSSLEHHDASCTSLTNDSNTTKKQCTDVNHVNGVTSSIDGTRSTHDENEGSTSEPHTASGTSAEIPNETSSVLPSTIQTEHTTNCKACSSDNQKPSCDETNNIHNNISNAATIKLESTSSEETKNDTTSSSLISSSSSAPVPPPQPPKLVLPMPTVVQPIISAAGVLAALMVQDEVLEDFKRQKDETLKTSISSSNTHTTTTTTTHAAPEEKQSSNHHGNVLLNTTTTTSSNNQALLSITKKEVVASNQTLSMQEVSSPKSCPSASANALSPPVLSVSVVTNPISQNHERKAQGSTTASNTSSINNVPPKHASQAVDSKGSATIESTKRPISSPPPPIASIAVPPTVVSTSTLTPPNPLTVVSSSDVIKTSTAVGTKKSSRGLGNQKWEDMYKCLKQYVELRRKKSPAGRKFVWDGHVPTNYKTPDGKALGRWVNNQRTAKTNGSLRKDREELLVTAGLKWSVLATSSWTTMVRELKRYIAEQNKSCGSWDGNVPTNLKIQPSTSSATFDNGDDDNDDDDTNMLYDDEQKNLGRWVNRQRCLYHAGRLKKEREQELNAIGLRWSVVETPSWEDMLNCLKQYKTDQQTLNPSFGWDGSVPVNYKTDEPNPKSLGRWVQRQRALYKKGNLSNDRISKLETVGFCWSSP